MQKLIFSAIAFSFFFSISFAQQQKNISVKADTLPINKQSLNFIAMGDWGRNGEYNQKEVADEMGIIAKKTGNNFFIITGDNFYPSGVRSTQDHRWIDSYENIYTAHSLQNDWYVALGNHDYEGNV